MKFNTREELLEYTKNIKGKTFKEIDSQHLLDKSKSNKNKGVLGQIVESGFYKYPLNNVSEADFEDLGIELKVSGYVKNKDGSLRAKERIKLSKIDYNNIVNETYESSHLLGKCKEMLIIWYHYIPKTDYGDFKITDFQIYDMSQDEDVFKHDFELIKEKVINGKAHELSEGDTSYLGACTSGATSADRTTQPFSDIAPKPRAYSLKNAYMTGILRELKEKTPDIITFNSTEENKKLIKKVKDEKIEEKIENIITFESTEENKRLSEKTVIDYVNNKLKPYFGKTQLEILEEITGKTYKEKIPKNINKMISDKLIGKDDELYEKDELFRKTSFIIKNIPIRNNKAIERMAFKTLQLSDFEEDWEDSYWKNYFEETALIVICYEAENSKVKNGYRKLKYVKQMSFTDEDLESFEKTYNMIKIAIEKRDINLLPTPNSFENQLLEIAPKGIKGDDAYNNFFKKDKTKVSFMISKTLLNEKLNDKDE